MAKTLHISRNEVYLIITVGAVATVEVGLVAVLVPPASCVRFGAVDAEGKRVLVPGGERAAIVVLHRVT